MTKSRNLSKIAISRTKHSDSHRCEINFEVGDLVWVVLTRDRFLVSEYNKLRERKIRLCEILQKINDNPYRLHLPSHLNRAVKTG
jgi:hypothetical protein